MLLSNIMLEAVSLGANEIQNYYNIVNDDNSTLSMLKCALFC
jgi:hypothetical protein